MAYALDNRNFLSNTPSKALHPTLASLARSDMTNSKWERSSSTLNQPPPSYAESVFTKASMNHSLYHQHPSPTAAGYIPYPSEYHTDQTKPPPPVRLSRLTSTTNNNYIRRGNVLPQYPGNGIQSNTTYSNSTQLYITQPPYQDHSSPPPPPPPPRYPLHPPAIPPRQSMIPRQSNSVTIPDFNSSQSPKTVYRSPVPSSDFEQHSADTTNEATFGGYFGECRKCGESITSLDDPCDILGQTYHSSCAVCVLCGRSVKNKHFFVKDQLYCEEDFLYTGFHQTLEHCVACNHLITDTILQALGESYHLACFRCSKCSICLDGLPFIRDKQRNLFCLRDYHLTYGPRCDKCSKIICPEDGSNETVRIISMGKTFHVECYQCEDCSMQLSDEQTRRCYPLDDTLLCEECCRRRLDSFDKF